MSEKSKNRIDVLDKFHSEVDFATKAFETRTSEFGKTFNESMSVAQNTLKEIETYATQNKVHSDSLINELKTFTLLPEKIATNIKEIVPQIAAEVEKIHEAKIQETIEKLKQIQEEATSSNSTHQQILQKNTEDILTKFTGLAEQLTTGLKGNLEQILKQFAINTEMPILEDLPSLYRLLP
jgi:DNA-directed RNA polymerase subunit F